MSKTFIRQQRYGFVGKWKMFFCLFVGKRKMFFAIFVGKWKMFGF